MAVILNFGKTLKKSHAHLHILGPTRNKRTEVLYQPPPYILKSYISPRHTLDLDFLRSQIFKKLYNGGHFKFQ